MMVNMKNVGKKSFNMRAPSRFRFRFVFVSIVSIVLQ